MGNRYSHWRTPKLEAELAATKKLASYQTPKHYPKANKGMLALEKKRYDEMTGDMEAVLRKRRK